MLRRNISDVTKFEKAIGVPPPDSGDSCTTGKTFPNEQPAGYFTISERVIYVDLK